METLGTAHSQEREKGGGGGMFQRASKAEE